MSKLIEDLSKRCYITGPIGRDGWPEYTKFDHQFFAELIIEECKYAVPIDMEHAEFVKTMNAIQEHFKDKQ